jgi:hypothetical protein
MSSGRFQNEVGKERGTPRPYTIKAMLLQLKSNAPAATLLETMIGHRKGNAM